MYSIGSSARRGFGMIEVGRTPTYDDEYSIDHRAGFGVVPILGAVSLAGSLVHTSAAGPNADAASQVLPLAMGGNLAAVAAFITRAGIQTVSSAAPWKAGLAELQTSHPEYVQAASSLASWMRFGAIPPTAVLASVSGANAVYYKSAAAQSGVPGSPNQPGATGYHQPLESGVLSMIFSPVGLGIAAAIFLLSKRR